MNRQERIIVDRIDRAREAPAAKAKRTQRAMYLRMQARQAVTAILAELDSPSERAAILGDLIDVAAERRWPIIGRVETATGLNSVAADVCAVFRLDRGRQTGVAKRAWVRATATNDGRGQCS